MFQAIQFQFHKYIFFFIKIFSRQKFDKQFFLFAEESVSVDTIKNAFKLFQKWDILECHAEKKLRLYYLKDSEDNSDSVKNLYTRINKFRGPLWWYLLISMITKNTMFKNNLVDVVNFFIMNIFFYKTNQFVDYMFCWWYIGLFGTENCDNWDKTITNFIIVIKVFKIWN